MAGLVTEDFNAPASPPKVDPAKRRELGYYLIFPTYPLRAEINLRPYTNFKWGSLDPCNLTIFLALVIYFVIF